MNIVDRAKEIALNKVRDTEYNLYDVEYIKEGLEYFLRIYFDKDGGLNLDDCVKLSDLLSEEFDKEDFISDKYYLEVSSPGIEIELRNLEEISSSIGKYVCLKTYEKINNQKEFFGDLIAVDKENILIEYKDKTRVKKLEIDYAKIAKIRLAVKL
ncbi:ribosome maturation factor RimP [Gemella sp. zg-570]|uniref:ribosome maturation factor RimP n=1 Tax=Gemella sp. zg-570 TaxID=2840371 RepID=UPI001C0B51D3|nr:ribosome maturation factor RimP [Gemella sp. zg-570]QWQ39413.1 ribosome maturation factor RimP [Gemella sp. zg-570]